MVKLRRQVGRVSGTSAAKWSLMVSVLRLPIQLITQGIIARTLGPENFGVFGVALIVFMFAAFVSEFGFGILLMQRSEVTVEDRKFALTWQILIGVGFTVLLWISAPWLGNVFESEALVPVIRAMSIGCIINGLTCVPGILLAREMRFGAMGLIDTASYVIGYAGVGVYAALHGLGVHSMVLAWLVSLLVKAIGLWCLMPLPIGVRFRGPEGVPVWRHGATVTMTNIVNWVLGNIDRIAAGRLLSMSHTGGYIAAYNLSNVSFNVLLSALQPAFMSRSAQMQFDVVELQRVYRKILGAIGVILAPLFVCMAMSANDVVAIIYGHRFDDSGPVLGVLFAMVPVYLLWGLSTPVLWNLGKGGLEVKLQLPLLALGIAAVTWVEHARAPMTLMSLAAAASTLVLLRAATIVASVCRSLDFPMVELARVLGRSAILCLGVVVVIVTAQDLLGVVVDSGPGWKAALRCLVSIAAMAAFLAVVFVWGRPLVGREGYEALDGLMPTGLRRYLPKRLIASMSF